MLFQPNRTNFEVDTNNLVNEEMVSTILDKLNKDAIEKLNIVLKRIKFYVGGHQWHSNEVGVFKHRFYEFDFKTNTLYFFLAKIFYKGYQRWIHRNYGALKRFIWESFFHEVIRALMDLMVLNEDLLTEAENVYFYEYDDEKKNLIENLFDYFDENCPKINFIMLNTELWNDKLPSSLGFLDILYTKKIDELKMLSIQSRLSNFRKIKLFNELRKIKLHYEYEYNLSELVNYCIYNQHFESYFKYHNSSKLHRKFYYKVKRLILKFFDKYELEIREYEDSAGRVHKFIRHDLFERVKSACLQVCIQNIKIEELDDYRRFKMFYSKCPICKKDDINQINCERIFFGNEFEYTKKVLITAMNQVDSLEGLNDDEHYFGVPCEDCFSFTQSFEGKFSELDELQKFIQKFNLCPLCAGKNHIDYLISFYYDESKRNMRNFLINNTEGSRIKNVKINIGIPCCKCYEEIFNEPPDFINPYSH